MSNEYDEQQAHVSRLLAAAGGPERTPPEVVARLDAVLADLAGGPQPAPRSGTGADTGPETEQAPAPGSETGPHPARPGAAADELAARRRSRRGTRLLLAAAAVSVLGLGVGALLGGQQTAGDAESTTAGAAAEGPEARDGAESAAGGPGTGVPEAAREGDQGAATQDGLAHGSRDSGALTVDGVARLHTGSLTADLQRVADRARPTDADLGRACVRPALSAGDEWLRVRLDGAPAVLVLRAPRGERRTAEVFSCADGGTPAATRRIDAR